MRDTDAFDDGFMPVFLINGFLEAGKTQFLQFTMQQDYFQTEEKTLLIVCEEGEEEYDAKLLERTGMVGIFIEGLEELTPERLFELELLHNPGRVVIEWNGMWNMDELQLPSDWHIYQQVTIIDMSTFDLYAANMKPLLYSMVKNSELIICNRCDEIEDLPGYRRTLKSMCQRGEVIFEDSQGEVNEIADEDLPYDVDAGVIEIQPEDYGIWYMDCLDRRDRYEGKTVEFTAMVLKRPEFPKDCFVAGRMAMTCCAEDMTFLGFITNAKEAENLQTKQWVKVRVKIAYEFQKDFGRDFPVLYAELVQPAEAVRDVVQF